MAEKTPALPLGAVRTSGGRYTAQWSIKPGQRANVSVPAEAYDAGALAQLGGILVDTLGAPHGIPVNGIKE